jgi:eukaryotic-like serine/threonine-protein kinase
MDVSRWNRLTTLFREILEKDAAARTTMLDKLRVQDPDMFREVKSLLDADTDENSILDGFAVDAVDLDDLLSIDGSRIGPWRVVRRVGSGGMGNVYLAEREEGGFEQRVALKLIRHGMDSVQILRRFESERRIQARLQHPNIARLLDGGLTNDHRPWFAMEYVEGESVDRYCNNNRLGVEDRLNLFITIASAVQYAHSSLVVHRDLKPDNILVSGPANASEVKLLDFGIASVLDDGDDAVKLTRDGARPMTPAYAAPEQLLGKPVTTAGDVYALGVVLYELLSGCKPYNTNDISIHDLAKWKEQNPPSRPSSVAVTGDAAGAGKQRHHPDQALLPATRRLRRRLEGDLDVIILKAMDPEPGRRYQTVEQFIADIQRHLAGQPVKARPESKRYRLGKFIRRHKPTVVAGTLVLITLLAGIVAFAWQYNIAAAERDRARIEAETSLQVAGFLQGLFASVNPSVSRGDMLTARELLDRGAAQIGTELAGQPDVQARMLDVLGDVYISLWMFDDALNMYKQALSIRQNLPFVRQEDVAQSYHNLGMAYNRDGRLSGADSLLTMAIDLKVNKFGERHPSVARSLREMASLNANRGRYDDAIEGYQMAISIYEEDGGTDHEETILSIKSDIGQSYYKKGDYTLAERYVRESLVRRRELYPGAHPSVSSGLHRLAEVLHEQARYEESRQVQFENLEMAASLYGEDHPVTALGYTNYAGLLKTLERYAEAEAYQHRAHHIFLGQLGDDHPQVSISYNNLANLKHDQGDLDSAVVYHALSLELTRRLYGDEHDEVANSLNNLGAVRLDQLRYAEAESLFRETLDIDIRILGEKHPFVAMDYQAVGITLMHQGKLDEAEPYLLKAIEITRETQGEDHPRFAIVNGEFGRLLLLKGEFNDAEHQLAEVLERHVKEQPQGSWRTAEIRSLYGEALFRQGRLDEAGPHLINGYEELAQARPNDLRFTALARNRLADYYEATGNSEEARKLRNQ